MYGLKQAPRAWYDRFSAFHFEQGFKSITADPSLFVLTINHDTIIFLLYVDDMLIASNVSTQLEAFLSSFVCRWSVDYKQCVYLKHEFSMTDLGHMHYFLGVKIDALNIGFSPSQQRYAANLLLKAGLQDCKPLAIPMATKLHPPDDSCFSLSFTLSHNCGVSTTPHLYKSFMSHVNIYKHPLISTSYKSKEF